jgi:ribosomal protein L7/L12
MALFVEEKLDKIIRLLEIMTGGPADVEAKQTPYSPPTYVPAADLNDLFFALKHGDKIDAVRRYRALTGVGLLEAKQAVEIFLHGPT